MQTKYADIVRRRQLLDEEIRITRERELPDVLRRIRAAVRFFGLTAADIFTVVPQGHQESLIATPAEATLAPVATTEPAQAASTKASRPPVTQAADEASLPEPATALEPLLTLQPAPLVQTVQDRKQLRVQRAQARASGQEQLSLTPEAPSRRSRMHYRDPVSNLVWTGMGRKPEWLKELQREHKKVETYWA